MKLFTLSDLELKKMEEKIKNLIQKSSLDVRWNTAIWKPKINILRLYTHFHPCLFGIAANWCSSTHLLVSVLSRRWTR